MCHIQELDGKGLKNMFLDLVVIVYKQPREETAVPWWSGERRGRFWLDGFNWKKVEVKFQDIIQVGSVVCKKRVPH